MKQIIFSKQAQRDLEEIFQYISKDNRTAAIKTLKRIHQATETLLMTPKIGRTGLVENTREFPIPGLPYLLPYKIRKNESIFILRVYHGARKPLDRW